MFKTKENMKKIFLISFLTLLTFSCVGTSSVGIFGSGVSVAYDPRTVGMQIDDSIMQKNLIARLALTDKKYIINRFGVIAGPWQFVKQDQGFIPLWIARHLYKKKLSYILA